MPSKYYNTMSKIKTDEEFKKKLIEKIAIEEKRVNENEVKNEIKIGKGEMILMKIKKAIITITSIIGVLLGSGVAYAAFGGTINGVPVLEWMGIKFSEEYVEYVEPVVGQVIEDEGIRLALESTVCDDGFTVLQFRVNLLDDRYDEKYVFPGENGNDEICLVYLSFNDPIIVEEGYTSVNLGGSNYNVIINGEKEWLRGASLHSVEHINERECIFYQMWFFDEDNFKGETEFTLSLKDIAIGLGNDCIPLEGEFEVEVSKNKALENTKTIDGKDTSIDYKKTTNKIEKIVVTPLQNLIKLSTISKDASIDSVCDFSHEDNIGMINYKVYDQYGNELVSSSIPTEEQITYKNGKIEKGEPGELEFSDQNFKNAEYIQKEYLVVEKDKNISKIRIEVFSYNDYTEVTTKIGEYNIDLEKESLKSNECNEIIEELNENDNEEYYEDGHGEVEPEVIYTTDGKEENIEVGNKDYMFLYEGFELEKKVGIQYIDFMSMNKENNKKYNTEYYNYVDGKYTGKSMGIFGRTEAYDTFSFVESVEKIATSKKYNLFPREYKILEKLPKELIEMADSSNVEIMKIDLDGDNKTEYIVCNSIDYTGYDTNGENGEKVEGSSTIMLLNDEFKKIADLVTVNDDYIDEYANLRTIENINCFDIDNDGIMEIIIDIPVWEGMEVSIYKYSNGKVSGEINYEVGIQP